MRVARVLGIRDVAHIGNAAQAGETTRRMVLRTGRYGAARP